VRERAQLAGGWCRIESDPGTGTAIEFWVPLTL
jgi:signal transduction histidine kinase